MRLILYLELERKISSLKVNSQGGSYEWSGDNNAESALTAT